MNRLFLASLACGAVAGALVATTVTLPAATTEPVRTDAGALSGTTGASGEIRAFKGIPYAAPPTGGLRWKAPQPVAHWDGVRKAEEFGPRCMQAARGNQQPAPSEDCLYLNVWTGAQSATERRPVMVFTYGGSFTGGSGSEPRYDGEALAKKGVVAITYNYRLGPFGWLAHPELTRESGHNASGNQGLADAIAALQWVQKNVAAFGGDPRRVTIFGESAGGIIVAALVASPESKGLFQRAISESASWMGTRMVPTPTLAQAEADAVKAAASIGVHSLAEMRAKPAAEIQKDFRGARPIVEGYLIPEDLSLTFAGLRQQDVDTLLGSNKDEGTFFVRPGGAPDAYVKDVRQRFGEMADTFLNTYPGQSSEEAYTSQLAGYRDEVTWLMRTWAESQAKRGRSKSYVYYFTQEPPAASGQQSRGATHTAELNYVFNNLLPGPAWTDADRALADAMSSYWVNFATTGDPNGKGLAAWPAYRDKATGRAMVLGGGKMEPEPAPFSAALTALYDSLWRHQMSPAIGKTAAR
jgi:para-nitrobenzyl esterase